MAARSLGSRPWRERDELQVVAKSPPEGDTPEVDLACRARSEERGAEKGDARAGVGIQAPARGGRGEIGKKEEAIARTGRSQVQAAGRSGQEEKIKTKRNCLRASDVVWYSI